MRKLILSLVVVISITKAFAQETNKAGTSAAQFLKIGVGAKEIAMAGASAGLVENISSMYWNPAGMVNVNRLSVAVSHTTWFADMDHNYFGLVIPVSDDQAVGVSATVLSMGKMEITTENDPQGTGQFFEASDVVIGLTYSVRLVDFFTFGGTLKYVSQSIYNETASAYALDLGTRLNTGFMGIKIGMAFTNFGSKMKLEGRDLAKTYDQNKTNSANTGVISYLGTQEWELPINFRVGIGWDVAGPYDSMLRSDEHRVKVGIDANHPNDAEENVVSGIEYTWRNLLNFRTGYHFNDDVRKWAFGVGLNWQIPNSVRFVIDYAYSDLVKLGEVHTFGVQIGF